MDGIADYRRVKTLDQEGAINALDAELLFASKLDLSPEDHGKEAKVDASYIMATELLKRLRTLAGDDLEVMGKYSLKVQNTYRRPPIRASRG